MRSFVRSRRRRLSSRPSRGRPRTRANTITSRGVFTPLPRARERTLSRAPTLGRTMVREECARAIVRSRCALDASRARSRSERARRSRPIASTRGSRSTTDARRWTRALAQAASHRMMAHKSRKFHGNIHRRGAVDAGTTKKKDFSVGPVMLGFFVFVVVGSSILQVLRSASSGPLGGASAM